MTQRKFLFKVVIVGDGGVGKSTMVQRLTTGQYIPQKITIGTDLATYDVEIDKKFSVRLQIWDFAGERRFRLFLPNYSRGAVGCMLCYDITRRISFESLKEWYKIVNDNTNNPVFILVGEKLDLADNQRIISSDQAEEFKKKYNIEYFFETSSKNGKNNNKIFKTITRAILEKKGFI